MELWIRSQDKTNLILAKDIVVRAGNIKVYKDTELCTTVAMYKTKERALEVLDEIQKMLDGRWIKEKMPSASMQNIFPIMFYEMPKE
jgi:hypothetical protein